MQRVEILNKQIKELQEQYQTAISKQVTAMREAELDRNAETQRRLQLGEITVNEIDMGIRNGILGGDIAASHWIEEGSPAAVYAGLAAEIKSRISQCLEEKNGLEDERGLTVILKRNFDLFVKCLIALPEVNKAGQKMNINGLDVDGSLFVDAAGNVKPGKRGLFNAGHLKVTGERIAGAPDFLEFDKGLYLSFFPKATVKGNTVEYVTNFGVKLVSSHVDRTLPAFLGYRKCAEDGTVDFLTHSWQVNGRSIQYNCKARNGRKKADKAVTEEAV